MALGNLGKYSAMLQNMPNPNTGTHAGGLSHVLQQALLGYSMGQDQRAEEATQGRLTQMLKAMTGTPDTQGFAPDEAYNPPGAFGAGVGGPPPLSMDPDRAQITIPGQAPDLMGAINIGAEDPALQELTLGLLNQQNQSTAAADAAEAARLQGIEDDRSQFMFELENGPGSTIKTAEGVFSLNPDGTLGARLGSPVVSGGDTYSFGNTPPEVLANDRFGDPGQGLVWELGPDNEVVMGANGAPIAIPYEGGSAWLAQQERDAEAATATAEITAESQAAIDQSQGLLDTLWELKNHPGFSDAVGMSWDPAVWADLPGTEAQGAKALHDMVQGGMFMTAFESLKGAGQITENESKKATDALSSLSLATSEADYNRAVERLEEVLNKFIIDAGGTPTDRSAPGTSGDGWGELRVIN